MKKKVLICSLSCLDSDPRPLRLYKFLRKDFDVSFMGLGCELADVKFLRVGKSTALRDRLKILLAKLLGRHSYVDRNQYRVNGTSHKYTAIFCHSLDLLPLVYRDSPSSMVIFDAREYYPKHFENSFTWRLFHQRYMYHLCQKWLPKVDKAYTVSEGLSDEYSEEFGVKMDVVYSLPKAFNFEPGETSDPIRLVHHGIATPARKLERLIQAMEHVSGGVTLDIYLKGSSKYSDWLRRLARERENVRIMDAVPYDKIIPTLTKYDVGLIFFPPSTFNLQHCMPNKLFEYIQARLAILVSPLDDVKRLVLAEKVGFASDGFGSQSLSNAINALTVEEVQRCKNNSGEAALRYRDEANEAFFRELTSEIV